MKLPCSSGLGCFKPAIDAHWLLGSHVWSEHIWRLLLMQDYNTRVVLLGTVLLGVAAGVLGIYLLLRRRALIGDAISHATLPGVAVAFMVSIGRGEEKSLGLLLLGAAISGSLGGVTVLALRHIAKIREDAALGIVLSVFFGAGVALVSLVQDLPGGNAAGLEAFIYGKAASMTTEDVWLCGTALGLVLLTLWLLQKEMRLLCFDSELARTQGWPVLVLDSLLIGLVVLVTIVGLQAVGLILIIALLIVPAASARFWTHELSRMSWISGALGGISCGLGTLLSAMVAKLPSGATIVVIGCGLFVFSFIFGRQRGVLWRAVRQRLLRRDQDDQHFLRTAYELLEADKALPSFYGELKASQPIQVADMGRNRGWSASKTRRLAKRLDKQSLLIFGGENRIQLTPRGLLKALELARDHRLLERYMIQEASAQGLEADREADYLEHGLLPEHLAELSVSLPNPLAQPPPSPHATDGRHAEPNEK